MPRSKAHLEINNFTRGIITEASPLTFPENASLDEQNFELKKDGSRERRLGMDYEDNYETHIATGAIPSKGDIAIRTFNWENAGGNPDQTVLVVQMGDLLFFYDNTQESVSPNLLSVEGGDSYEVGSASNKQKMEFASVDGILVCVSGQADVYKFSLEGANVSADTGRLKIRDVFGVEDTATVGSQSVDLLSADYLNYRPEDLTAEHAYNLSNQSWGTPKVPELGSGVFSGVFEVAQSPIHLFKQAESDWERLYPSNSDTVHVGTGFNTDGNPKPRFFPERVIQDPPLRVEAPKGYFIIDALERGTSRQEAYDLSRNNFINQFSQFENHPELTTALTLDKTPDGAKTVEEFAGRIFYAGFSGEVEQGDSHSPRMSSYVLFSQVVKEPEDIFKCYQKGDPTSEEEFDLVATDGGFIKIQGAYGIQKLVNIGSALIVLAENGVWSIRGESGIGFSATSYEVTRLSEHGVVAAGTAVVADNTLFYWGDSGIYHVTYTQTGELTVNNLSSNTIQSLYEGISDRSKALASGAYDSYSRKIRWLYNNSLTEENPSKELVLDLTLQAFYVSVINETEEGYPILIDIFTTPPYTLGTSAETVVVGEDEVEVGGETVQVTEVVRENSVREIKYLCVTEVITKGLSSITFTFSQYKDQDFLDWKTFDGTGVDANAFLVTGYTTGGNSSLIKQAPVLYSHFRRTEDGFQIDGSGDMVPTKPSGCKVQAQWEWANSANSNRWGKEFQAYQYKRHYIPEDVNDPYDYGFETIVTRRKLRGKGRSLSLKFSSEPGKDLRLVGWGLDLLVQGRA